MVALDDGSLVLLGIPLIDRTDSRTLASTGPPGSTPPGGPGGVLHDSEVVGWDPTWFAVQGLVVNASAGSNDGGEVNGWGRSYPTGGILDPDARIWLPLPERPRTRRWLADPWVVAGSGLIVDPQTVLDVRAMTWRPMPPRPELDYLFEPTVTWAGDRLFVWGGVHWDDSPGAGTPLSTGWTWGQAR